MKNGTIYHDALARKIGFNKDDIFIDIGANTGLVSVPFEKSLIVMLLRSKQVKIMVNI